MKIIRASLSVISVIMIYCLTGCGASDVSVSLEMGGETLYKCRKAEISELSPKNGGHRFTCLEGEDRSSVYVFYDTTGSPMNGTLKYINILYFGDKPVHSKTPTMFRVAYYANNEEKDFGKKCPAAKALKRKTGEQILETGIFGSLKKKSYRIFMADPCGELTLKIGDPEK